MQTLATESNLVTGEHDYQRSSTLFYLTVSKEHMRLQTTRNLKLST